MSTNMLTGVRVRLRPYTNAHVTEAFGGWLHDVAVQRMVNPGTITLERPDGLLSPDSWLSHERANPNVHLWGVHTLDDDTYIAVTSINVWDQVARHGEIGIQIGEAQFRGKGYGGEIMQLVMRIGFRQLNLNQIHLRVFGYNTPGIRLYEKLGFRLDARERGYIYRDRTYWDQYRMSILKHEWEARYDSGQ